MRPLILLLAIIVAGANGSENSTDAETKFIGARGKYWAFQVVQRPEVPTATERWVQTPIDAFILTALRERHLAPSPKLDRIPLIRRVTLDLIGLPPTPAEIDAFVQDRSPGAYEKVIDRLLASKHYGERWAMKWLDVVRYADTNGFELDADRPHAWRYRDYVIDSFNRDKPFDRFLKEQIAGDEMYPGSTEAIVATGFARAGSEHLVAGNIDPDVSRQEVLTEITTSVGQTFMGLTVNCARCHNHKFDPILQADYYRLQAVFAGAKGKDVPIATPAEKDAFEQAQKAYKERVKPVETALKDLAQPYKERLEAERLAKLDLKLQQAWKTPKAERTAEQELLADNAKQQIEPTWDLIVAAMTPEDRDKRAALRVRLHEIEATEPDPSPAAYAYVNTGEQPPLSHVLRMGDPKSPLAPVEPGVPRVLKGNYDIPTASPGRRAALAKWLASPQNPFTARVMVNRIWQSRMGTGLVGTPNDFGVLGQRPVNQKLLDWLTVEFTEHNWSVKHIDRLILLSSAYRQASAQRSRQSQNRSGQQALLAHEPQAPGG